MPTRQRLNELLLYTGFGIIAPMITFRRIIQARFEILVGLLVLVGFGLRLGFLLGKLYHIDEFITMLAAVMVAQKGLPLFPSGLFYDSGFLYSEIAGLFVAALGFAREITRWPALIISTITIATYFTVGRRLSNSRLVGLAAAALVAFDGLSIVWGGRARMYGLAHFFVLLSLVLLLESTLKRPNPRGRYLFLLALAAALLSHMVSFLVILPLLLTLLFFTLTYNRTWFLYRGLWREVLAAAVIMGGTLAFFVAAQEQTRSGAPSAASGTAAAPGGLNSVQRYLDPGLAFSRFDDLLYFFIEPDYLWLLPFVALAIGISLYRLITGRREFVNIAVLFLSMVIALIIVEQGMLFGSTWQKSRYLFITALPAFLLVGATGLAYAMTLPALLLNRIAPRAGWVGQWLPAAGVLLLALLFMHDNFRLAVIEGTGNYDTAFEYVRQQMQPNDKIITVHPSAAYLFAGQSDYYASQGTARVLSTTEADDEEPVDRYVGGQLLTTVEQFNQALQENPAWFVVDDSRLYARYDPYFTQQFFAQMDYVHRSGQIFIFRSNPHPVPVPVEPAAPLDYNFAGLIALQGYSLDTANLAPDGTIPLGLYWRPLVQQPSVAAMPKIFVQVRNNQNQVVAQADHFFYEGLLTIDEWGALYRENEWLRDTADLQLPLPLNQGPYQIYVGLYNPETLERVPIANDTSGENAAVISLPDTP